jgi:hypothetical protein
MTFRLKHIVSTAILTLVAAAFLAPGAQARVLTTGPAFNSAAGQSLDRLSRDFPTAGPIVSPTAGDRLTRDFPTSNPVSVVTDAKGSASGSGVDWTAVAVGGALAGLLLVALGAGIAARGVRTGSLAT